MMDQVEEYLFELASNPEDHRIELNALYVAVVLPWIVGMFVILSLPVRSTGIF